MWGNARMVVLTAICAALYAAILIPFKVVPLIPGITEFRPVNAIPVVCSFLFGRAAAWGAAFGNLIGDFFGGLGPGDLFGFLANLLYGLVPYALWEAVTDLPPVPRGPLVAAGLLAVIALAATLCAAVVGWGLHLLGFHPFTVLGTVVLVNNLVVAVVLAPFLLAVLYPRVQRARLLYRDLLGPRLPPPRWRTALGAGKSTLARCLTRLVPCFLPADLRGEVRLLGQSIEGARVGALAGTIGMVFQDFEAQLFSTDVTQEIVFGLEHTGVAPGLMPERVARALAAVGLAGFEGRDPTTLSGGEKQRLAIAGLLALRPPIMVLDEPTTDLDPTGRAEVFDVLGRLRADGLSLVLIEHDTAAAAGADLLLLLRDGRIVANGPPAALLADVEGCLAAGVRPLDVCRVFAALGLAEPPLDVATAAERLRARGLRPVVPDEPG